jgi:hypothetical protein
VAPADVGALGAAERRRLLAFRAQLADRLVLLVVSRRPDWGFALLVGMARLQVLDESARTGRLVVLDPSPMHPVAFPAEIAAARRTAFAAARADTLARDEIDEWSLDRLEAAMHRLAEAAGERHPDTGPAPTIRLPAPALDDRELAHAEAAIRDAERRYDDVLGKAFGYGLLGRNCATELFATIDAALGRAGSVERLGGWIDPRGLATLVPLLSFRAVRESYRVVATGELPSYRTARLADMYARQNRLAVYLRESNTLTSTIYRPLDDDPPFLFFTDDVLAPRPFLGIANAAAGIGETLVGILRSPFDRGRSAWSGVREIVFSLPELAFVNLRKGTMAYPREIAPGAPLELDDPATASARR